MGGSGGGGYFRPSLSPDEIQSSIRAEQERARSQTFDAQVSDAIGKLLADYNNRDATALNRALDQVKRSLERDIEGSVSPMFGGSVRKHTYVDGISDVDCLLILKDTELKELSPDAVLDYFEGRLRERFPDARVDRDNLAVTVIRDGLKLQLLPAIKIDGVLSIASSDGHSWSKIQPEKFFNKLSQVNAQSGYKVIPTIKLVKGINDTFPSDERLTGYHIESLAINAFKTYTGPQNTKALLEHFFREAKTGVLTPIRDSTGQSVHVDEYMGAANSSRRKRISARLDRIYRQMKNADATQSLDHWLRIVEPE